MSQYGPQDDRPYPQQPPQPYGQMYSPPQTPQGPTSHAAPRHSQGLAITSLVMGVAGSALALLPALRGVGLVVGFAAVVLAIVALAAKSQGGKMFAAGGLALGFAALPIAVGLYMLSASQERGNLQQQQQIEECILANPETALECAGLE
ncbi:hypothetical protein ACIBQX_11285 [Nonomuraea sp. NPDC049714]|uniref:hypothetical protein n=1 Tax=Nonomuraea sp. NPDC049714 TaxID=3364357 RepID=UPI0037914C4F